MAPFDPIAFVVEEVCRKRDLARGLGAAARQLLIDIPADELAHAEVVAAGAFQWRQQIARNLGVFFGNSRGRCDDFADVLFAFLRAKWREQHMAAPPGDALSTGSVPISDPGLSAKAFLDHVEIYAEPTEAEIEDAWEVEIGSAEPVMRQMWEGSARTRRGKDLGQRSEPLTPPKAMD